MCHLSNFVFLNFEILKQSIRGLQVETGLLAKELIMLRIPAGMAIKVH